MRITFYKKWVKGGLNVVLRIGLFLFLLSVINLIIHQYYFRFDFTGAQRFIPSEETSRVLKGLHKEIQVMFLGKEGSPSFREMRELLEGYRYINQHINYSILDLDRSPLVAQKYGIGKYDTLVVETERGPVVAEGFGEAAVTNAILKATREKRGGVYFLEGRGEKGLKDEGRAGFSRVAQGLAARGYPLSTISLMSVSSVPNDASLLVTAGPTEVYGEDELIKLREYIRRGGRLLILADPEDRSDPVLGLLGIGQKAGGVVDASSNLGGMDPSTPLVLSYPENPMTHNFKLGTAYPGAAALVSSDGRFFDYTPLIRTSEGSSLLGTREKGPFTLGYLVTSKRDGTRMAVVFGDSEFASNAFFQVMGNGSLFLNAVDWLSGTAVLVSIPQWEGDFIPLYLTPSQGETLLYIFVIAIPLGILSTGGWVWLRRRGL